MQSTAEAIVQISYGEYDIEVKRVFIAQNEDWSLKPISRFRRGTFLKRFEGAIHEPRIRLQKIEAMTLMVDIS